ncbi:hypothetical protein N798_12560 [Knoellia flava TL1]|uniref:Uncharacterized protein n=2 Tax=Knoellia flava TaxID=913969 RepID=A0A8H9KPN5_9MICO|nr:hypothetical protein [Knoellia flava]KGN29793.1 hypothetical protein N798_12560 [Knoellia flava TL1]GGB66477.1 hypothetical protein GCM10011314_02030 [Knoellia flava]
MTFENLPANLRELALDDPVLRADAVDLFVTHADRESGCVMLLLLDEGHRVESPVVIGEMGRPTAEQLGLVVDRVVAELRPPALLVALGRGGSPLFTDGDRECHQVLVDGCRDVGVELLATYVVTPGAVRELPDHLRIAS